MPPAVPKTYRVSYETLQQMAALSERWGGVQPITSTAVFAEAVRRAYEAEFSKPKPKAARKRA